ncbi:MAG: hypothetical protein HRU20_01085 [Pseudomonadales bacterium]|nr:hypothetical protein [Pseudomonadales bacterium]
MDVSGASSILLSTLQTTPQSVQGQSSPPTSSVVAAQPSSASLEAFETESEPVEVSAVEEPVNTEPDDMGSQLDVIA